MREVMQMIVNDLVLHCCVKNILNHHDVASDGHKTIEQAVESMTSMARHINDMKQRHEHAIRTQEIQSMLYEWDGSHELTTLGDLILEVRRVKWGLS